MLGTPDFPPGLLLNVSKHKYFNMKIKFGRQNKNYFFRRSTNPSSPQLWRLTLPSGYGGGSIFFAQMCPKDVTMIAKIILQYNYTFFLFLHREKKLEGVATTSLVRRGLKDTIILKVI